MECPQINKGVCVCVCWWITQHICDWRTLHPRVGEILWCFAELLHQVQAAWFPVCDWESSHWILQRAAAHPAPEAPRPDPVFHHHPRLLSGMWRPHITNKPRLSVIVSLREMHWVCVFLRRIWCFSQMTVRLWKQETSVRDTQRTGWNLW